MPLYLDVLMLLNFLVDFLLLIATNRLSGYPVSVKRAAAAAVLGGVYGGACMLPGFQFLGGTLWRVVSLALMAGIAFGFCRDSVRRGIVFILLSMALGGVALGLGNGSFWTLLTSAAAVSVMCILGFRGKIGAQYVPVEVQGYRFTALHDTGNTLADPITGQQVLVVSAGIGRKLLGLTMEELTDPVKAMGKVTGLRLLPYHAVGCSAGMLAARRFDDVRIGRWKGSCLVAFAPNDLGQGKPYDALTGGVL